IEARYELESGVEVSLRGRVDRLTRNIESHLYEPVEIKQYLSIGKGDELQLDFYLNILQDMQEAKLRGHFWLGSDAQDRPRYVIQHVLNPAHLNLMLRRAYMVLTKEDAPPVNLLAHCKECPWYAACTEVARSNLDLSLLPRLNAQARKHLERGGITSLQQLAALSIEELQRFKGIKKTAASHRANALAFVEDRPVWVNAMPDVLHRGGWMFDLETAALPGGDGLPWSLGWSDEAGNSQIAIVAPDYPRARVMLPPIGELIIVRDKDEAWEAFHESVGVDDKPIYHWSGFDAGVMRATAPDAVKNALLGRMHDLHSTFVNTVRLPLRSYSIKKVAAYFGFSWKGYAEWWAAETDYRKWLISGEVQHITHACEYQRDDVLALAVVWKWLIENHVNPEA
ncbi:MAG: ribonuclease H-like domain-containing protein, partial [Anaerolineae bacterium]|nr:ribonuclease H-like domain-containing protein [Anaerolineae bacterium]